MSGAASTRNGKGALSSSLGRVGPTSSSPGKRDSTRGERLKATGPSCTTVLGCSATSMSARSTVSPRRTSAPFSRSTRVTIPPSTSSPFAELRSTTRTLCVKTSRRAWRLEMSGSVSVTSDIVASRPRYRVPRGSANAAPVSGPSTTVRVATASVLTGAGAEPGATTATVAPDPRAASAIASSGSRSLWPDPPTSTMRSVPAVSSPERERCGSTAAMARATSPTEAAASVVTTMSASGPVGRCRVSFSFMRRRSSAAGWRVVVPSHEPSARDTG